MKRRKMGFSGFNFTEEAKRLAPHFCSEVNTSIYFKPNGCVHWIGRYRKVWLDQTRYIARPIRQKQKAPQNLLHLLFAFTDTHIQPLGDNHKVAMSCNDPRCVNPDHMVRARKYQPLEDLYPKFVEEGEKPGHTRVATYVVSKDMSYCKEFNNMESAARWVKVSRQVFKRYAKTGRLFRGKWYIIRETYNIEEDESSEHEYQEEIDGTGDIA